MSHASVDTEFSEAAEFELDRVEQGEADVSDQALEGGSTNTSEEIRSVARLSESELVVGVERTDVELMLDLSARECQRW